jgi:microcystin-dependent protein
LGYTSGGGSSHNNLQPYIVLNYYVVVTKNVTDPGITGNADTVDNCNVNDSAAPSSLVLWTSQKEASYFATASQGTLATNALPASSYTASDVLTKVKSVDGSGSGLDADTVDGSHLLDILKAVYPVGCIYMAVLSTSPATLFGFGTWVAWGTGEVPVGVDTAQTEFNTVEKTGGEKTHALSVAELPVFTPSVSIAATNIDHTHSASTASAGAHSHGGATTNTSISHTHGGYGGLSFVIKENSGGYYFNVGSDSDSTHRASLYANTAAADYVHAHAINSDGGHTHTMTMGAMSTNTSHGHTATVSAIGSGAAHNNMQPYITCYMWKRTA